MNIGPNINIAVVINVLYQMYTELIDTSKMESLDMDINNNRQHNCSISLSTLTTADTEDRAEDNNMSPEELRECLNIEATNMKKKLQQKSDTKDKEARRIRRIQKREEKKRLKNMEYVNQWDVFFQDFNLLDSTPTHQLPVPKSDIAKKDDNSTPTQRSKRRHTISVRTLSKSLSIRRGRNRKKDSLSKSSKSIRDMLSFITGSTAKQ